MRLELRGPADSVLELLSVGAVEDDERVLEVRQVVVHPCVVLVFWALSRAKEANPAPTVHWFAFP